MCSMHAKLRGNGWVHMHLGESANRDNGYEVREWKRRIRSVVKRNRFDSLQGRICVLYDVDPNYWLR